MCRAEPELREQRARVDRVEAGSVGERLEQRLRRRVSASLLPDHTGDHTPAHLARPARELELAEERAHERRLAGAVRAGDDKALSGLELEVHRPEAEASAFDDGSRESGHRRRKPAGRAKLEPELPRLERLLGQRVPLEQLLGLPHLRAKRVRPAPVGAARLLAEARALCARLGPPRGEERGELAPALAGIGVVRIRGVTRLVAPPGVVRPAARPIDDRVRAWVDLRDAPDRPVEERPIVRDEDDRPGEAVHERLELREPVRVEVVRRLVQEKEVRLHEEDGREGRPCRLAAGESVEHPVEVDAEPDPRAGHRRARVEIAAAEREEPREGRVVAVGHRVCRLRVAGKSVCRCLELALGRGDAGQPGQPRAKRLAGPALRLLPEMGDRRPRRIERDDARIGRLLAGEQPQDGRLADAVRPDEPDARARTDLERRVLEDDLCSVGLRDAGKAGTHDGEPPDGTGRGTSGRRADRSVSPRSVRHGRAPKREPTVSAVRRVRPERLERRPAGIDRLLGVLVRLDVQVLPADRAKAGAVGAAQDLVGEPERHLVPRPRADVELSVGDVLAAQLLVRAGVSRVVLLRVDLDRDARRGETSHARPFEPRGERQAEEVARRGSLDDQLCRRFGWHCVVRLAAEDERVEHEPERLVVLLTGAETKASDRETRHGTRVAPAFAPLSDDRFVRRVKLP